MAHSRGVLTILAAALLAILAWSALAAPEDYSPAAAFSLAASATFPIYYDAEPDARGCSAFHFGVWEKRRLHPYYGAYTARYFVNVTAGHCKDLNYVMIQQRFWLNFYNLWLYASMKPMRDSGAFLSLQWTTPRAQTVLMPATVPPYDGEPLAIVGYANELLTNRLCHALPEDRGKGRFRCTREIGPGASGGPVVNMRGEVVGVVTHVVPRDWAQGFYTRIEAVRALLEESLPNGQDWGE